MDGIKAETISSFRLLQQPTVGFYIPPYQREYSWDYQKVLRLFKDASHGLRLLFDDNASATTFLGTIIVIHDTRYATVDPKVQGDLPKSVQVVIDGQQRLATILLSNVHLHSLMATASRKLAGIDDESSQWLYAQALETQADLRKTFEQDMVHGEGRYQFYPRMIRAYVDSWSRSAEKAAYESPIAAYLAAYSSYLQETGNGRVPAFKYQPNPKDADDERKHDIVVAANKYIKGQCRLIAAGSDDDDSLEMPKLSVVATKTNAQQSLFRAPLPQAVTDRLIREEAEDSESDYCRFFRLLCFARFWLDRVAVVYVTAATEDYAFDIFDALNTTGEPLTAFETFRPEVMKSEGLAKYEKSESRASMRDVENVLDVYTTAEQKRKATDDVLLPFSLAENGMKLSRRLNEQRVYLRREYARLDKSERIRFVRHLADTATFVSEVATSSRDKKPANLYESGSERDLATMCLDVLRKANHNITTAPLVRFYSAVRAAQTEQQRSAAIRSLEQAIKAVTAFWALWRGSRRGTKNIDAHYRRLMRHGLEAQDDFLEVPSFCRRDANGSYPQVNDLCRGLRHLLAARTKESKGDPAITCKNDWKRLAKSIPVYSFSVPLARFLLFAASHDTVPDKDGSGLVVPAKSDTASLLTWTKWTTDDFTVEHVWPKSRPRDGWDPQLAAGEPEIVDCLGNLTLIPSSENSSLGDRSWVLKRAAFKVLASESREELVKQIDIAKKAGLSEIPEGLERILGMGKYLPHLRSVAEVSADWNVDLIDARSECMAEIIWDRISPWLGY